MLSEEDKTQSALPSPKDSLVLANVLNEILRGFDTIDFEAQIGASKGFVQDLEDKINNAIADHEPIALSRVELLTLQNALSVTEIELGDEDFSTRVGVSITIAHQILARLATG